MHQDESSSSSSAALERMKAAAETGGTAQRPDRVEPAERAPQPESAQRTEGPEGAEGPDKAEPAEPAERQGTAPTDTPPAPRLRHANTQETHGPLESFNDWLDGLGEPDWDKVSQSIYDSPATMKAAYERQKAHREAERVRKAEERRLAQEQAERDRIEAERQAELERQRAAEQAERDRIEAERIAAEEAELEAQRQAEEEARQERERLLELQRAEEEALRQEMERQEHEEWLARQRERETWALQTAARESDGTDWVPPADRRAMLEDRGENLTDAELLDRARASLPEWRHRDRIVEKAQAIEAATVRRSRPPVATLDRGPEPAPAGYIPPYNLPSLEPDPAPAFPDLARRMTVTVAYAVFVLGGVFGLGLLGEDATGPWLHELHEGRFRGGFSMLSMAPWHQFAWPLLWLAMGIYTVHQWLPSQAAADRQRATGWRMSGAMVLAVTWFAIARTGVLLGVELFVWLALGYLLVDCVHQLNLYTARSRAERAVTDGTIGLFTGWALIFAATNASIWLQSLGINLLWIPGSVWAVLTLVVVIWGAAFMAMTERGRITIALGLSWGLAAILVPRLVGSMTSVWVAIVAAMGLFVVLLATENRRYRINHAEHRAALGHEVDDF
ncbi:hypothetical protein [Citricoccus nitrophenolicus]|uniref:hypothetical protein n=2 Tax=Citricoccus nitrophenolicus TaxID=863575 RepID=UPI0031EEA170